MLKTREYYKILHFLKVESVDRIYPVEEYFYAIDEETGEEYPIIYEGDSFLFETNRQQFSGLDYVEVLLESSQEFLCKQRVPFRIQDQFCQMLLF